MEKTREERELSLKIKEFLRKDSNKFSQPEFESTKLLIKLLQSNQNKETLNSLFDVYIESANEGDDLINKVIELKYENFNALMEKPNKYGETYEYLRKLSTNSRRKIAKSKDVLVKKQEKLDQLYLNSLNNSNILESLKILQKIQGQFVLIDSFLQVDSFYELRGAQVIFIIKCNSAGITKNRGDSGNFEEKKQLNFPFTFSKDLCTAILNRIQKKNLTHKNKFQLDRYQEVNQQPYQQQQDFAFKKNEGNKDRIYQETHVSEDLHEFQQILKNKFSIDLAQFQTMWKKLNQIQKTIYEPVLAFEEEDMNIFDCVGDDKLLDFIEMLFQFEDYEKVSELVKQAEEMGDTELLVPSSKKNELLNLFLIIKSSQVIGKTNELMDFYFNSQKINIETSFKLVRLFYLQDCIQNNDPFRQEYFDNIKQNVCAPDLFTFSDLVKIRALQQNHEFFKQLICLVAIMIRKYVIMKKVLKFFKAQYNDDNPNNVSFGYYTHNIISYTYDTIHYFLIRPFEDPLSSDFRNESTQLNMFEQSHIKHFAWPSFLHQPFILVLTQNCFSKIIQSMAEVQRGNQELDQVQDSHEDLKNFDSSYKDHLNNMIQADKCKFYELLRKAIQITTKKVFKLYSQDQNVAKHQEKNFEESEIYNQENLNLPPKTSDIQLFVPILIDEFQQKFQFNFTHYDHDIGKLLETQRGEIQQQYLVQERDYLIQEFPQLAFVMQQITTFWNVTDNILDFPEVVNIFNYQLNILHHELKIKIKQLLKNTLQENFLLSKNVAILKMNPGFQTWKVNHYDQSKLISYSKHFGDQSTEQKQQKMQSDYEKALKFMYRDYFKRQAKADRNFLLNQSNNLIAIATLLQNLNTFILQVEKLYLQLLTQEEYETFLNLQKDSKTSKNDEENKNQDKQNDDYLGQEEIIKRKIQIILESRDNLLKNKFLIPEFNNVNVYTLHLQESLKTANFRFLLVLEQFSKMAEKLYLSLKSEMHFHFFSFVFCQKQTHNNTANENEIHNSNQINDQVELSSNLQDYHHEFLSFHYAISQILPKEDIKHIFDDYTFMLHYSLKKCITSLPECPRGSKLKNFQRDVMQFMSFIKKVYPMEDDQKGLDKIQTSLKQFYSLHIVQEEDLIKFLQVNSFKYKIADIEEYFDMKPTKDVNLLTKRKKLMEEVKKYCKVRTTKPVQQQ